MKSVLQDWVQLLGLRHQGVYALCKGLHMNPESCEQMGTRLNADEVTFASQD